MSKPACVTPPLQLRLENEALQQQNLIFGKVLAVRDAMVHTLSTLHGKPPRQEQQAAAQGLARALQQLPSEREMEEAHGPAVAAQLQQPQQDEQQRQQQQQPALARTASQASAASTKAAEGQQGQQAPAPCRSSSPSGDRSANTTHPGQPPRWALLEHHREGAAAQLDGGALREVGSIPAPSDELVRATVMAMSEPEHLVSAPPKPWEACMGCWRCEGTGRAGPPRGKRWRRPPAGAGRHGDARRSILWPVPQGSSDVLPHCALWRRLLLVHWLQRCLLPRCSQPGGAPGCSCAGMRLRLLAPLSHPAAALALRPPAPPQLDYYRQWQAELAASYIAAEAGEFDAASVAEVEAVQERMASVWWHVGHLKPAYLCYLTNAALPEDSAQFPLWRELAERLLPELDENSRAILVRGAAGNRGGSGVHCSTRAVQCRSAVRRGVRPGPHS